MRPGLDRGAQGGGGAGGADQFHHHHSPAISVRCSASPVARSAPRQHPAQRRGRRAGQRRQLLGQVQFGIVHRVAQRQDRGGVALDRQIAREEQRVAVLGPVHHRQKGRQRPGDAGVMRGRAGADGRSSSRAGAAAAPRAGRPGRSGSGARHGRPGAAASTGCARTDPPRQAGQHQVQRRQRQRRAARPRARGRRGRGSVIGRSLKRITPCLGDRRSRMGLTLVKSPVAAALSDRQRTPGPDAQPARLSRSSRLPAHAEARAIWRGSPIRSTCGTR
jgi:hypothetical protein